MAQRAPGETRPAAHALDTLRAAFISPLSIAFLTVACLVMADVREARYIDPYYEFLRWNLFLALVPLGLAYLVSWAARWEVTWPALPVLGLAWIIFLPNAPYLITDLVHLEDGVSRANIVSLGLLAVTGLVIGVKAVQLVHGAVERLFGVAAGRLAVHAIAVLCAFGIYLGRVKRWNSWTVIEEPHALVNAVLAVPSNPDRVVLALAGTVVFAICFLFAYRVLVGPNATARRAEG